MRFFNKRVFLAIAAILVVVLLAVAGGMLYFLNSPAFEERARETVIREIEESSGGRASLDHVRWNLWDQRFVLQGLTIRGLEPQTDLPLARLESISAGVNLRSLLKRRVDLFELIITRPEFHLLVDASGKTNLPNPPPRGDTPLNFEVSIANFRIADGSALINDRRIHIDLALAHLASALSYAPATRILSMQLTYDGQLHLDNKPPIPYTMSADLDYTRGAVVAQRIVVKSGKSAVTLQGRINEVLTSNILGRLEYKGAAAVPFLNHFFPNESFAGFSEIAGFLEFSNGYFFTRGSSAGESVTFNGWTARKFRGEYSYHYPERRLVLHHMTTQVLDGTAEGDIAIEPLPGPAARVSLALDYTDVDAAQLARIYPWDPMYRIYSRLTGTVQGWFEGKFDRFELGGNANFKSYPPQPSPGIVALPLDGSSEYAGEPNRVRVSNAAIRLFSTDIEGDGLIDKDNLGLKVHLASSNLRNLYFVYGNANGGGSFDGTLSGPIKTPVFDGTAEVRGYKHGEWTLQHAAGGVHLDTLTQVADLRNVAVTQGQSVIQLRGKTTLDGSKVDLQIQAANVRSEDIAPFAARVTDRKFSGMFSGAIHITSLDPIRFDDDLRANDLVIEGQRVGNVTARVVYREPFLDMQKLMVSDNGATLTGNVSYNRMTEALNFKISIENSLNLERLRTVGLPMDVEGMIRRAEFTGSGTPAQPRIHGSADLRNLSFHGESFPQADLDVDTVGPQVKVELTESARNLRLAADIDTSRSGYPFKATVSFTQYSIERLIGFSQGTVAVTGNVTLNDGLLNDFSRLTGNGTITSAQVITQDRPFKSTNSFRFQFDPNRLTFTDDVALSGPEDTQMTLGGNVALTKDATLDLHVRADEVNLALAPTLLGVKNPPISLTGSVTVNGHIGGTSQKPDLGGIATFTNASISKPGFSVSLSAVNGSASFGGDRVTLNDLKGRIGPGTVSMQGFGTLKGWQIDAMNVQMETHDIRIRYPKGVRTILDGDFVLRGNWDSPVLDGNLHIQNLAYRGAFEDFIGLFQTANRVEQTTSDFGRLALSLHVEGSRNISIQNELADVEASVDLDIKGTVDRPALTGHVEASGGTLTFQNRRYQITRGNMDFIDPLRIEPVIDVQAETELRDYRVILMVTGRGDRVSVHLRSDPPLPELEIISLITGGKTREELAGQAAAGGRVPTSEELFQGGAASILSDVLKSRVVPSRFGLLGLERLRIDPFLVGPENNPSARITVPLQVSKDLAITYSQDLVRNTEQIIQIEYFVSKNISILATRDDKADLGLDLRLRRRY